MKDTLTEEEKKQIQNNSNEKYILLCNKFNYGESWSFEIQYEFDEGETSKISVEDEINCSNFVLNNEKPKWKLFFEDSLEFENFVESKGVEGLIEKAAIFLKVKSTPNRVFVTKGLDKSDNVDFITTAKIDKTKCCDNHFRSVPIDNGDEIVGLSEKTWWRVKGRYISCILNVKSSSQVKLGNSNKGTSKSILK